MRDLRSQKDCEMILKEFQGRNPEKFILMIDGHSIDIFMSVPNLEANFFQTAT